MQISKVKCDRKIFSAKKFCKSHEKIRKKRVFERLLVIKLISQFIFLEFHNNGLETKIKNFRDPVYHKMNCVRHIKS